MQNRQILITGSSLGIGKQLALFFAEKGYNIIITYKTNKNKSKELQKEIINKYQVKCNSYYLDVTKEISIKNLYKKIMREYKNIDILINNAATDQYTELEEKNQKNFKKIIKTNLIGPFLMIKYYEQNNNKGTIINIASTDGIDTNNFNRLEYCASKAGLINLTKSLSLNLKNKIFSISPNWVKTEPILEMNEKELKEELKKVNQKELINPKTLAQIIYKTINDENIKTGKNIIIRDEEDGKNY